jgi:rhodanese-related sulfurtransferase
MTIHDSQGRPSMSKHKPTKQSSKRNTYLMIAGVVIILLIAAVAFVTTRGTTNAGQKITPTEYQTKFAASSAPYVLIDVRTPDEFATGHIHNAVNIPLDSIETRLTEIPRTEPVVIYCHSGNRSGKASQILANAGYTQIYDLGGINAWTDQGFPIE